MAKPRLLIFVGLIWVALGSFPAAAKTSPEEAAKFLDELSSRALAVLRNQNISLDEREARVRKLLHENFDFKRIGRFVLGKAWRTATPEQRAEYQRLFAEFVARTYAHRLGGYSGERFRIIRARPLGKRDAVVLTEISRPSGPPVRAGWRVRAGKNGLKILDVIVEGVSMVVTQKSEFQSVVRKHGLDGLIEILRLKINKFSARQS